MSQHKDDTLPILETPRLRLRPFRASDAEGLHECFGDPAAMRYWDFAACRDVAETARWVHRLMKPSPYSHAAWAVAGKPDDRLLGLVNYHHREARNRRLEVGYILVRAQWGKGLMTEAMTALLRHCFEVLETHRVEALIEPENQASIRLVHRLGFRREGDVLRDRILVDDGFRDLLMYALLEDEAP